MVIKSFNETTWWLNLTQSSNIGDGDFVIAKNVFYNNAKQLQTRRGYRKFWAAIWSHPITSYFFNQRDDNRDRVALCHSGNNIYSYDDTSETRSSVQSNLREFETLPWQTDKRVRYDFAVYNSIIYMCNGVDPYMSFDTSISQIWVSAAVTCTFDNSTDKATKSSHWLSDWDELFVISSWTMPWWLTQYQVYYVINSDTNTFELTTVKNWTKIDITSNGTGTVQYQALTEPRTRYIQYLGDRLYTAWDDANPITLYYTNALPTDGTNINQNAVVIWWDEQWVINGINEYSQVILVFKSNRIYSADVATPAIDTIDVQSGWYADRTIFVVDNNMLYFNERGIDSLNKQYWISGVPWIWGKPLSDKVRNLVKKIKLNNYNAWCSHHIKDLNNYYFSFDTNADDRPDTHLVYNTMVWGRTQYIFPNIYDYGIYVNSSNELQHLFASASGWQMYEFEYWFDDDWVAIEHNIRSKPFDFGKPSQIKEFDFLTLSGYKALWEDMTVKILVDWETVVTGYITDDMLEINAERYTLGVRPMWVDPLTSWEWDSDDDLVLYKYNVKIPFFNRGHTVQYDLYSEWVQRIHEKVEVSFEWLTYDVFYYNSIL